MEYEAPGAGADDVSIVAKHRQRRARVQRFQPAGTAHRCIHWRCVHALARGHPPALIACCRSLPLTGYMARPYQMLPLHAVIKSRCDFNVIEYKYHARDMK